MGRGDVRSPQVAPTNAGGHRLRRFFVVRPAGGTGLTDPNSPKHSDFNHRLHSYEPDRRQPSRGAGGFIGYSSQIGNPSEVAAGVPACRSGRRVVEPHRHGGLWLLEPNRSRIGGSGRRPCLPVWRACRRTPQARRPVATAGQIADPSETARNRKNPLEPKPLPAGVNAEIHRNLAAGRTEAGVRPRSDQGATVVRVHFEFGVPRRGLLPATTPLAPVRSTPPVYVQLLDCHAKLSGRA